MSTGHAAGNSFKKTVIAQEDRDEYPNLTSRACARKGRLGINSGYKKSGEPAREKTCCSFERETEVHKSGSIAITYLAQAIAKEMKCNR
jgi:hypothetical protein